MTSKRNWGWALLITGIILNLGIAMILAVALTNDGDAGGIRFVSAWFVPWTIMTLAGIWLLRSKEKGK